MKVVFLYPLAKDAFSYLRENLPEDIKIVARIREEGPFALQPNVDPEIVEETKTAEILMGPYVTEEILSKARPEVGGKLKLIFVPWTGVDRLDLSLIKKYNIPVANSHGNARTIAEFGIALLLTAAKNIIHHDQLMRKGDWSSRFRDKPSINITGKTVGLLGFGAIGTECAKLLQGFDVKLVACRRTPSKTTTQQKKLAEEIFAYTDLVQFLNISDIIINSLPLTDETKGFLGKEQFNQMKDGVIMINVGRGETIEEEAIFEAVKSGKVFAAGLDPQWHYPTSSSPPRKSDGETDVSKKHFPSIYPIHEFDNVVLSPHRAGHLVEGYERSHWQDVIENILRIYHGKEPINIIDIEQGY
ncbi:MAG TPA: 2-hydroxyacid dehydrogenase [Candidatus Bathyarchaeia archaeon]|nr:2-hydroxyacid dehydrogenase [Candidatus Bathyarchaeia archaeon]